MTDEECLQFLNKFKAIPWSKLKSKYNDIFVYLLNRFPDCDNVREAHYRLNHHIFQRPLCPVCNKELQFVHNEKFPITHSGECANKWKAIKNREVFLLKFGCENPFQNQEIKNKIKRTNLQKYGVENPAQSNIVKQKLSIKLSSDEVNDKKRKTYKLNNSYNRSKDEDKCYDILRNKYSDVKRQYKSELYPFACDFYIPSIDTYIEYNGSHYHQYHPFDSTNENDIKQFNKLIQLANNSRKRLNGKKSQYDMIIYTWTDLDVRKRKIAKENNLNYIEIWGVKEIYKLENI